MKKISKSFYFVVILFFLSSKHSESQQLTNLDNNNEPIEIFADNGIDGITLSWVDYKAGLSQFESDILPLMREAGLRQ